MNRGINKQNKGFTLIEVSIVLVIIGLIVGGVVAGQQLIKQAELRSVIRDIETYNTAVNAFKTKYNCLPGDCASATAFFGAQAGCPNTALLSTADSPLTCDGNGNGAIWSAADIATALHERLRFWQHLSAAGLIGTYSGIGNTSLGEPIASQAVYFGFNAPKTKIPDTGIVVYHGSVLDTFSIGYFVPLSSGHMFILGSTSSCDDSTCTANADEVGAASSGVTPETAFMIDRKIDDGKPGGGGITAPPNDGGYSTGWAFCTTGDYTQGATATYNLNTITPVCPLFFKSSF